MILIHFESCFD